MTDRLAGSLSERLDRDGPDSVLRKAARLGPEAEKIGRAMVALDGGMRRLRAMEIKPEVAEDKLAGIVARVGERLGEPAETGSPDVRKPPFPDTDEELSEMAEESNGGRQASEAAAAEPAVAAPAAVRRGTESEASSSGVINLKALADDYQKQKTQKAEKAAVAALASRAEIPAADRRRSPMPVLVAVAGGLVAVVGILIYFMASGRSDGGRSTGKTAAGTAEGPTIAAATGPSATTEQAGALADQQAALEARLAAQESSASQEEIERLRKEIEELKTQRVASEGPGAEAPADQPPAVPGGPTERSRPAAGAHAAAGSSAGPPAGGRAPAGGGRTTAPAAADAGTASAARPPPPPPSSVVSMLGGGRGDGGAAAAPPRNPAAAGTGGSTTAGGDRSGSAVAGSLTDVLGAGTPPPAAAATPPVQPAPVVAPPPAPAAPAEILPEIPARPDIRRATDSVKSAIFNCGAGQTGTVTVQFTVSGADGSVTDARVTGDFAGTAVGTCAERAARSASFPRFHRATFTVPFPFVLPAQ